jgi:hypothetical protein
MYFCSGKTPNCKEKKPHFFVFSHHGQKTSQKHRSILWSLGVLFAYKMPNASVEEFWAKAKLREQVAISPLNEVFKLWVQLHLPYLSEKYELHPNAVSLCANMQVQELMKAMLSQRIKNLRDSYYRAKSKNESDCVEDHVQEKWEQGEDENDAYDVDENSEFY